MSLLSIIIGAALFINGIFLAFFANFNIGIMLTVMLGVFFILWGVYHKKINEMTGSGIWKYVKFIVIALLISEFCLVGFIAIYGQNDNVKYDEDAIIVLGAGIRGETVTLPLKKRLDKAIEYHQNNPDSVIVVTGGQGFQETVTEAYAMEKYLIEHGIDKDKIIKEEKATSTNENMRFSKEILDKYFGQDYKIAVVTNNFHIYRGTQIAKNEGLKNVSHIHCGLQWYNLAPCYLRESLAVLKLWVIG